ncbi:MAG: hypothetical protein ACXVHB_16135 [Solirubrobacteraceae bacterium]
MASELTLSLMMGNTVDPVPRPVIEALIEATVTVGSGGTTPSGFDLKFATSKDSEITIDLLRSGFFDPPTRVVIAVTLRGATSVLMDGVITQQDVVPSDESGKSVLSIKGEDLTRMMDVTDLGPFPLFPAMPAEARVALMLAKYIPLYRIVPLVIPSVLIDVPDPVETIAHQSGTDLAYINTLADQVGYTFYLQPGPTPGVSTAYWGPKLQTAIPFLPEPTPFAIDWDGRSNIESLQFSFDGFKKTLFYVWVQIPDVPVPLPIPVPDVTPLSPPLGQKDPLPLKITPLPGLGGYSPIQAAVIALAKAADAANVISGQGSLDVLRYGSVLMARTLVEVRGAGITFDGQYFISSVTHNIRPGSYKQSFTLQRNRLIADGTVPGGLGPPQQLPAFATASSQAPPLPGPGAPIPVPAPGGPPTPNTGGGSVMSSLPGSPTS